jgi:hypothetical protein
MQFLAPSAAMTMKTPPTSTLTLTWDDDVITIACSEPRMSIEVRVTTRDRKHHVEVFRPRQAGALCWYYDKAKARAAAEEAAYVLALGLLTEASRGRVELEPKTEAGAPAVPKPRTHELVELAQATVARIAKVFGKSKPAPETEQ